MTKRTDTSQTSPPPIESWAFAYGPQLQFPPPFTGEVRRSRGGGIGAEREAIDKAEDRQLLKNAMEKIGLKCPRANVARELNELAGAA
jgi:hypothetical protein